MSYAITNDYYNSSYNYDIFSRRTQENSALQESQEKPQNKIADANVHASSETRANSTEYPRPSMNALMFMDEQSSASEIKDEQDQANAIEENTQTDELYMVGDPRAGEGTTYDYTLGYSTVCDFDKLSAEMETRKILFSYMDKYGVEEGKNLFYNEFGADALSYGKSIIEETEERFQTLNIEFRNAMRDMGLMTDFETYNNLPQNPELLAQVQERFEERMSALGIEKQEMPNTEFITNHETQEVTIINKDTGEAIDSFKFQY